MSAVDSGLYRTIWRWHFYAGLLVLPLVLLLSLTGALFLFKPQVDRWEERAFQNLPTQGAVAPSAQVAAVRAALPDARILSYRLPEREGDAAMVHVALKGHAMQDVFVSPQGAVLGQIAPDSRIIAIDSKIHGQLLLGRKGSWIVELAASWAIVLIATGLYLWWPRGQGLAGIVYPRLTLRGRPFWRDLHGVTGFWVSGLALVLLFTGLPWADAWGSGFKALREEFGLVKGAQDWTIGGRPVAEKAATGLHAEHDHSAMMAEMARMDHAAMAHDAAPNPDALLDAMVAHARAERLAFPALVVLPDPQKGKGWVVKSDAQNRTLRTTLRYDATGALLARESFATRHPIDRIVAYGVAWHEGQLLGWFNQLVGVLTALMLSTLVVSGTVLWWRRRPQGTLGAPPKGAGRLDAWGARALLGFLLLWLPMFTASLVVALALDRFVLPRLPRARRWLGA